MENESIIFRGINEPVERTEGAALVDDVVGSSDNVSDSSDSVGTVPDCAGTVGDIGRQLR